MANRSLSEQLDRGVEALMSGAEAPPPSVDPRVPLLLRIAADLRDLPRGGFRERLRAELAGGGSMTGTAAQATTPASPIREGFHTLTPYLTVQAAAELIEFVKRAFDGRELLRTTGSAGGIHAEVRIGDSIVMIGGGEAWRGTPMPTALHLYVKDADAVYRRALEAGGTSTEEPVDQPYGDREAGVRDGSGNNWYIATHRATGLAPQGLRTVTPYLHPRGAGELVGFLERAFGAVEVARATSPDGTIAHASVRIGDSILEMGEAHGPYQPNPSVFYLYVPDADGLYRQAVAAGATSQGEPADKPYGDRVAAVADPFGNIWYIATHVKDAPGESKGVNR